MENGIIFSVKNTSKINYSSSGKFQKVEVKREAKRENCSQLYRSTRNHKSILTSRTRVSSPLVPEEDHLKEMISKNPLSSLNQRDWRKLCLVAGKFAALEYINLEIVAPAVFEIKYRDRKEEQIALNCPTVPQVFLRIGNSDIEIKIMIIENLVDRFTFVLEFVNSVTLASEENFSEENLLTTLHYNERKDLCLGAIKHVTDLYQYIDKRVDKSIKVFTVGYLEREEVHVAMLCPTATTLYLRIGNSNNELRIMIVETVADRYEYREENIKSVALVELESNSVEGVGKTHLYSTLNLEMRWRFCFAAKRSTRQYDVRFRGIYVEHPKLLAVEYFDKNEQHVVIECPTIPVLYLRLGNSEKEIVIMTIENVAHTLVPLDTSMN